MLPAPTKLYSPSPCLSPTWQRLWFAAKIPQPQLVLPFHGWRDAFKHTLAPSPFFLSPSKALRFSVCLMRTRSRSTSLPLAPDPFALRLSQHSAGRLPASLQQTYSHKPTEHIYTALIFIKVNSSLKKMWLMMKVFTLQITFNNPLAVSLVINANPSISSTIKQIQLRRGEAERGKKKASDRRKAHSF